MPYELEAARIERMIERIGWPVVRGVIATQLGSPTHGSHALVGALRTFQTGYGRFTLTDRNDVYLFEAPPLQAREMPSDEAESEQIALAFARNVEPELDRRFKRIPASHVPPSYNYSFMQVPVAPETSVYPNMIDLRVDARVAAVTRYSQTDLRFVRTTPPAIDEAAARARILALSGGQGVVDELSLSEDPRDHATRSETIWYGIVLRQGGPMGIEREEVVIHADTGQRYTFT
jgi:hypothetical protein